MTRISIDLKHKKHRARSIRAWGQSTWLCSPLPSRGCPGTGWWQGRELGLCFHSHHRHSAHRNCPPTTTHNEGTRGFPATCSDRAARTLQSTPDMAGEGSEGLLWILLGCARDAAEGWAGGGEQECRESPAVQAAQTTSPQCFGINSDPMGRAMLPAAAEISEGAFSPLSRARRKSRFLWSSFMNSSFCRKRAILSSSRYCFQRRSCSREPWPRGSSPRGSACRLPCEPWGGKHGSAGLGGSEGHYSRTSG